MKTKQWNMGKEKKKYWVLTWDIILSKWTPNKDPPHNMLIWKLENIGGLSENLKAGRKLLKGKRNEKSSKWCKIKTEKEDSRVNLPQGSVPPMLSWSI